MEKNNSNSQTKLTQHKFSGKKLTPPLAELGMSTSSWIDDRLPDMLWAALFTASFSREEYLKRFEKIVNCAVDLVDLSDEEWREKPLLVTLSGIGQISEENQEKIIQAIAEDKKAIEALTPLLFFDNLPAREQWVKILNISPNPEDTHKLVEAIADCYFHQSQKATDCRWVKVLYMTKSGYILFSQKVCDTPRLIIDYPSHTEKQLRQSRPTVRSMEIGTAIRSTQSKWPEQFWQECYEKSPCAPKQITKEEIEKLYPSKAKLSEYRQKIEEINHDLTNHFWNTEADSKKDPKHEVAFGLALYSADLAVTGILLGAGKTSLGRLVLRTLVECLISLKYLVKNDDPELWLLFRTHGMGQAKLVLQRSEEENRVPQYYDSRNLGQIANDDKWVEFLPVDIGSWDDADLRKKAIDVGLKDKYDDYYTWGSSYTHGQWGAIRESMYDLCGNPLHRFHRVPVLYPLNLKDASDDILLLLKEIVDLLFEIYPKEKTE
jgi:hypothetical protein